MPQYHIGVVGSLALHGPHRLVVRTSRCGRENPGSTPGAVIYMPTLLAHKSFVLSLRTTTNGAASAEGVASLREHMSEQSTSQHQFAVVCRQTSSGPVAKWIRHRPTEPGIAGSSPAGVICYRLANAETNVDDCSEVFT